MGSESQLHETSGPPREVGSCFNDKLKSIKSEWLLRPGPDAGHTAQYSQFASRVNNLYQNLKDLIHEQEKLDENNDRDLLAFLCNEETQYEIDDCVRWCLLLHTCKSTPGEESQDAAKMALVTLLLQKKPILAFVAHEKAVSREGLEAQAHVVADITALENLAWDCRFVANHEHFRDVFEENKWAPVVHMIRNGMEPAVNSLLNHFGSGKPIKSLVDDSLQAHKLDAFRHAMTAYNSPKNKNKTGIARVLTMIQRLLNFSPSLASNRAAITSVLTTGNYAITKLVLSMAPEKTISAEQMFQIQAKFSMELDMDAMERQGMGRKCSLETAKWLIEAGKKTCWFEPRCKQGLKTLLTSDNDEAKELLAFSLEKNREWAVDDILEVRSDIFDASQVYTLIKLDKWDLWTRDSVQDAWKAMQCSSQPIDLLPAAVQQQKYKFVEWFIANDPESVLNLTKVSNNVTIEHHEGSLFDKKYPLWHSKYDASKGVSVLRHNPNEKIRKKLVAACIKASENMQQLAEIFDSSGQSVAQLCFDLSLFDSGAFPFDDFVRNMIRCTTLDEITSYEPTIRYADFPNLDPHREDRRVGVVLEHREIFDVLDWLRDTHKVEEIVGVRVLDRMCNPHDETRIGDYVDMFHVAILNWRCLDLSLSVFSEKTKESLRELHLYSSGKRAVLSHWLNEGNITSFKSLEVLRIYIIEDFLNKKRGEAIKAFIKALTNSLYESQPELRGKIEVKYRPWDMQQVFADSSLERIAQKAVPKLWPFIKGYHALVQGKLIDGVTHLRKTKIAILDSGIMRVIPLSEPGTRSKQAENDTTQRRGEKENTWSLWPRIGKGKSFVNENDRIHPWSLASDPHGTQMANLICSIDPHSEIYVAKVTEKRYGVEPSRVSNAIYWAIENDVDIISMSFAITEPDQRLQRAVQEADAKGIVLICSTHDEGYNIQHAYPASYEETITIAAAEKYGAPTVQTPKDMYQFRIHATNIAAGTVPYIQSEDTISGSSVAAAIASGLASLILCCHGMIPENPEHHLIKWRKTIVKWHFESLQENKDDKYIQLDKFCNLREVQSGELPNISDMITRTFGVGLLGRGGPVY